GKVVTADALHTVKATADHIHERGGVFVFPVKEAVLGADAQCTVDAAEEHHGGVPEDTAPTRGRVTCIAAVHCRYAPGPGSDSPISYPVPDSGVLTEVESADGWTADRGDEQSAGYLLQLEL
ncbi:MAG TPA: DUF6578 domain-containing protein, partial [Streptosporangiaceae bacterium]|nr:DUF6578 domain-containing protein [Streptosporangiaceae bacterium]